MTTDSGFDYVDLLANLGIYCDHPHYYDVVYSRTLVRSGAHPVCTTMPTFSTLGVESASVVEKRDQDRRDEIVVSASSMAYVRILGQSIIQDDSFRVIDGSWNDDSWQHAWVGPLSH